MEELIVLSDFDGTLTEEDIGYSLIKGFAGPGWKETLELWKKGEIGSEESHQRIYPTIQASKEELLREIDSIQITPGVGEFYQYLRERDISLELVSDGFDFYIEPFLKKHGLEGLKYYANRMNYHPERGLELEFPGNHPFCTRCANCKVQVVKKHLQQGRRVIYIGDSYSDYYGASISDLIFARKRLEEYCREKGEAYLPYRNFFEILDFFKENEGKLPYRFKEIGERECLEIL